MVSEHFIYSDLVYTQKLIGWDVQNGCSNIMRSEHYNIPSHTKPAVNGLTQYSVYLECSTGRVEFK